NLPRRGAVSVWASIADVGCQVEIAGNCFEHSRRTRLFLIHERRDKRMLAQKIHHAWNTARVAVNRSYGFRLKNLTPIVTCDSEPLRHVGMCLIQGERVGLRPKSQSLSQLSQMRLP